MVSMKPVHRRDIGEIVILAIIIVIVIVAAVFIINLVVNEHNSKKPEHDEADVLEKERFALPVSRKERFEKDVNKKVACVMVCCNMSEEDYEFIKNNMDYCDFFVIDSCNHRQQYSKKISELLPPGRFRTRRNDGWDTTAWKEFIFENYDELKKYSYVILANNSCRYDFSIEDIISGMHADNADFYGLMCSNEITTHYQSYFIVVSSELFASKDFKDYWERMPKIYTRKDAIDNHELKFYENFHSKGWPCNTYYKEFVQPYYLSDYEHRSEVPKFIKKTAVENPVDKMRYENLIRV